ncbi:hypothetical protein V1512DRAFT_152636 [Lipomyces arxii]|uniref:uncharacterized protein n=1 Tax=Lipomyces arxii TaxID=56418 RepID=UPI0034D0057D
MYDDKALCRYLRELPYTKNYVYSKEVQRSLLRVLFKSISANGKYLSYYFPRGPPATNEEWKMDNDDDDPSHPGRPCMHQFKKGEPTYRCQECGLDDTCVLCYQCYNASDHIGHLVTVSISQKDSGGVCDCGDPEAWVREVNCKYYSTTPPPPQELPDDLVECIQGTIARCLDYILDIFSCSPQSHQDCKYEEMIIQDLATASLDSKVYGGAPGEADRHNGQFSLVLWNDEKHSYADVIQIIARATKRREEYGRFIAEEVDSIGRKTVSTSSSLPDLILARGIIESIQLAASIRSMRDTFREEMCGTLLYFLNDLASSSLVGHHFVLRDLICETLCQPWRVGSSATKIKQPLFQLSGPFEDSDDELNMGTATIGTITSVAADELSNIANMSDSDSTSAPAVTAPSYWLARSEPESPSTSKAKENRRLRLDYLMLFDLRFWKQARHSLKDLFMSTMISNLDYKSTMGMHFAEVYPELVEQFMLADREPDCSMMVLSTQLFTCPTIATEIVKKRFSSFLAIIYTYLTKGRVGPPSSVDLTLPIMPDRRTLKNRRLQPVFTNLDHIISRNVVKQRVSCDESHIHQLADILLLFEGCAPFRRQINEHVEYESTEWVSFFGFIAPIIKLGRTVAKGSLQGPQATTHRSIRLVARMCTAWSMGYMQDRFPHSEIMDEPHFHPVTCVDMSLVTYPVVLFLVEFYMLSIHHPLHGFLTWLVEFGRIESPQQLQSLLTFSSKDPPDTKHAVIYGPEDMLMVMLDYPLRTLVLIAQVRVGLWVRNGYTLRTHEVHYRNMSMRDSAYARDIFGVQVMLATCTPSRVMLTLVERWSLMSWLCGDIKHTSFDETKLLYILEEFLHGMIVLLCERKRLLGNDYSTTKETLIEREIIQVLCLGPISFSELGKRMPEDLWTDEKFEPILRRVTNFRAPEGINDFGTYELKSEYFAKVDPYFFHYTSTLWDSAETALKKSISAKTNTPVEEVVIEPRLEPINSGPFTRLGWILGTAEFAQMIYVTLCNVAFMRLSNTSSLPESLLNLTLYLCHVAVLEDRIVQFDPERNLPSFSYNACSVASYKVGPKDGEYQTILEVLLYIRDNAQFSALKPTVKRIVTLIQENEPDAYLTGVSSVEVQMDETPADELLIVDDGETSAEKKKRAAKERQAKIIAEFQKQQLKFAEQNKGNIEEEDDYDEDEMIVDEDENDVDKSWKYPNEACILCRKPATENEIFGTIGFITESTLFRQTPFESSKLTVEAVCSVPDLDRPEHVEDYNASENVAEEGSPFDVGFPNSSVRKEPVAVSCGHIMHLSCYEDYKESIKSRQRQHVTRNPPENIEKGEFLCPLCRSLNNVFLPLIFKPVEKTFDKVLSTNVEFLDWIADDAWNTITQMQMCTDEWNDQKSPPSSDFVRQNVENVTECTVAPFYRRHLNEVAAPSWLGMSLSMLAGSSEERRAAICADDLSNVYNSSLKVLAQVSRAQSSVLPAQDTQSIESLLKVYGASISAAEIALRGANKTEIGSGAGFTVMDQISQRTLSFLRILRASSIAVNAFVGNGREEKLNSTPYRKIVYQQVGKLFFGQECMYDKNMVTCPDIVQPLLREDIFSFLAEASVSTVPVMNAELHNIMVLCYIAQVVKVMYVVGDELQKQAQWVNLPEVQALGDRKAVDTDTLYKLKTFMRAILLQCGHDSTRSDQLAAYPGAALYQLIARFTLPFLRKCALLIRIEGAVGYDESASVMNKVGETETARLLAMLKLPNIEDMVVNFTDTRNKPLLEVISRWCRHLDMTLKRPWMTNLNISLEFPAPLNLLKLPRRLHVFFQEIDQLKCAKCNKLPENPAICLFCGTLVCCQDYCCVEDGRTGECNQHMKECAGHVGIYLLITKCTILFLKDKQGSFVVAPYLDVHGEVDFSLKRGRPLYLSQKRYDSLIRNHWLENSIGSQIARRIEAVVDNGGWEGM